MNARCVGCGARFDTFQSKFGICGECNPSRYMKKDDQTVIPDPRGEFKMALPLPAVDRPAAVIRCVRSGQIAIFDPREPPLGGWGMRAFKTYRGEIVIEKGTNRQGTRIFPPSVLWRLWNVVRGRH